MSNINQLVLESLDSQPYRKRVEVIIKKGDKILFSVISPYPPKVTKTYYGFPGGGINTGDSAVKTCKKECLEELGVKIKNIKKLPITPFKFEWAKRKIVDTGTDYSKKLQERTTQYRGTITDYYTADFDKTDLSMYGADGQTTDYVFVSVPEAVSLMGNQVRTHTDPKNIPIFEYRLKALKKL